ncbi:MAG: hypothetical protein WBY94_06620 [Polyangiaceae bacterium]
MTLLERARRWAERLLGTWHEGPEPPERLREVALLFAEMHPKATRREWLEFAAAQMGESWRSGYMRGWEAYVRHPEDAAALVRDSEALADALGPGWRERLANPDEVVGD